MTGAPASAAARAPHAAAPTLRRRARRHLVAAAFLAPWLVGLSVFFLYPLAATVYFSFMRYDLVSAPEFVGLRNYRFLLADDPRVWQAARNTLWLVAVLVPGRMLLGLAVAELLARLRAGAGLLRTLLFLPALVPPVAGTIAFAFLLNPATGPVNQALRAAGVTPPLWFNDPAWAKPGLALLALWAVGDLMVIFLASLLDVPREQYEAAAIDGAGAWQRFRYVTLPNLSPVLLFAAVVGVIQTLQYFTQAAVAAATASGQATVGGGVAELFGYPRDATLTYSQWLYLQGFKSFHLGYASVLALGMLVVALAVTAVLLRRFAARTRGVW